MVTESSSLPGRPPQVTAAFWGQLAVAGLLAVLAVVNTFAALAFRQLFAGASMPWFDDLLTCGLLACLAVWLAVAAFGLRGRSRAAYWSSLAGLVVPPLLVAAGVLAAGTTSERTFGYFSTGQDMVVLAERLATWTMVSAVVNGVGVIIGLVLVTATAGMLVTGACRRFFA